MLSESSKDLLMFVLFGLFAPFAHPSGYYSYVWLCLELAVLVSIFVAILAEAMARNYIRVDPHSRLSVALLCLQRAMGKVANIIKSFGVPSRHEDIDIDTYHVAAEQLAQHYGLTLTEAKQYISRLSSGG